MGEFIIPINVREEKDLYTEYDPSGLSFHGDLSDYLGDYVADRKLGEKVCLVIQSNVKIDMERFQKAFLLFIEKLSRRNQREMMRNQVNSLRLLVIGIASESKIDSIIAVIISTIGSFSIWEASAIWLETLPSLKKKERLLNMFADTKISYIKRCET